VLFSNARNYDLAMKTQVPMSDAVNLNETAVTGDLASLSLANNYINLGKDNYSSDQTVNSLYNLEKQGKAFEAQSQANLLNSAKIKEGIKYNEGIANANIAERVRNANKNREASVNLANFKLNAKQVLNDANTDAISKFAIVKANDADTNQLLDSTLQEELYQSKIRDDLSKTKVEFDKRTVDERNKFLGEN